MFVATSNREVYMYFTCNTFLHARIQSFVRGGPNLITFFFCLFFLVNEEKEDPNTTINE